MAKKELIISLRECKLELNTFCVTSFKNFIKSREGAQGTGV